MIDKLLENEKYEEALKLLVRPKTEKEYYQKIICLFSLNKLNEAKVECELALDMAEKMYYDITALYVSILTSLDEDELAIKVLEEELEMPYIPYKYPKLKFSRTKLSRNLHHWPRYAFGLPQNPSVAY